MLGDGATHIGASFEWMDTQSDSSFTELAAYVSVTWCAVVVFGGPWTDKLLRNRKLAQPHGRLSADPESARPRHAVVVAHWGPRMLDVYDPWFSMLDQPLRIDPAWLRAAWTGEVAYFSPPD